MEFLAGKDATISPSQDSIKSADLNEFIKKIVLEAQEELQNESEFSFQSASQQKLPANVSSVLVTVIQNQKSPNGDSSNDSSAKATASTEVTMESSTDHEPSSSSNSSVMTDATPLGLSTYTDVPVMTDATPLGLVTCTDSSVMTDANSSAEATIATEVTMESSTDHESRSSSNSPVMMDVTPVGLSTCPDIPVMTDASPIELSTCTNSSVVTNGSPEMIKEPEKCLVSSNEDSCAIKGSSDILTIVEDSVISTRNEPKAECALEDQIAEGSSAKSKISSMFTRSSRVFPVTTESGETVSKKKRKIAFQETCEWDEVIFHTGSQDHHGNDVFVLDLRKLSKDKHEYHHCAALCSHITTHIKSIQKTQTFALIVKTDKHKTRYSLAKEIYRMFKNSFSEELSSCVIDRPAAKLKAMFYICKPFLQRKMRNKICIAKTAKSITEGHGIPDTVLQLL